jgi:hypothetical protein
MPRLVDVIRLSFHHRVMQKVRLSTTYPKNGQERPEHFVDCEKHHSGQFEL